ncbi:MAG: hypothetical protein C4540_02275 [Candidatus Omnitrophota bacterium]|nr:MAG: hypothetical protein C4540_02275 [Candidatus Omnitrophota bacterium]
MLKRLSKRAQTTAEYAILIALVVGAVIAMQIYVRRSLQGKIKDATDLPLNLTGTGYNATSFNTTQYEPYYFNSTAVTNQRQTLTEQMQTGGGVVRGTNATSTVARNQTVGWR